MDLELRGRRGTIVGGTHGIGRAVARLLAEEGCSVGICARSAGQVASLASPRASFISGTHLLCDGARTEGAQF